MAGYITIGDLIKYLSMQDPSQAIIYQYYLADHFDTDIETFARAAEVFDSSIPCLDNSYEAINEQIAIEEKSKAVSS
jgi:hypothetical protein